MTEESALDELFGSAEKDNVHLAYSEVGRMGVRVGCNVEFSTWDTRIIRRATDAFASKVTQPFVRALIRMAGPASQGEVGYPPFGPSVVAKAKAKTTAKATNDAIDNAIKTAIKDVLESVPESDGGADVPPHLALSYASSMFHRAFRASEAALPPASKAAASDELFQLMCLMELATTRQNLSRVSDLLVVFYARQASVPSPTSGQSVSDQVTLKDFEEIALVMKQFHCLLLRLTYVLMPKQRHTLSSARWTGKSTKMAICLLSIPFRHLAASAVLALIGDAGCPLFQSRLFQSLLHRNDLSVDDGKAQSTRVSLGEKVAVTNGAIRIVLRAIHYVSKEMKTRSDAATVRLGEQLGLSKSLECLFERVLTQIRDDRYRVNNSVMGYQLHPLPDYFAPWESEGLTVDGGPLGLILKEYVTFVARAGGTELARDVTAPPNGVRPAITHKCLQGLDRGSLLASCH